MPNATITRAHLCERIASATALSRAAADKLVQALLQEIEDGLVRDREVKIARFGNFQVRAKAARVGRNPKTKVAAPIAARVVVTFKPSQTLKARVNKTLRLGR